jgi:predicted AlkP superfamily pyrophosphatase or phosphodiesterase
MWWGGEPIWVTAERSGRHAGTMFWPGSEAPIGGVRPTEWRPFAQSMTGTARVDQVLTWLDLPSSRRPALLTLYLGDTDSAGHAGGPDSEDVRAAIERVDGYVGRLLSGLARRGLQEHANVVVVSDHGMAATVPTQIIELDRYVRLSEVEIVDINPGFGLFPAPGRADAVYRALKPAHPRLRVFRREETPPAWHYRKHPRIPPIIGLSDEGWQVSTGSSANRLLRTLRPERGAHGYDPSLPSMHGILIAAGPAFKQGVTVPAMENVHVYDVLASVLGVTPAPNDGDMTVARRLLQ